MTTTLLLSPPKASVQRCNTARDCIRRMEFASFTTEGFSSALQPGKVYVVAGDGMLSPPKASVQRCNSVRLALAKNVLTLSPPKASVQRCNGPPLFDLILPVFFGALSSGGPDRTSPNKFPHSKSVRGVRCI